MMFKIAIDQINQNDSILSGFELQPVYNDTHLDQRKALFASIWQIEEYNVIGIIGI